MCRFSAWITDDESHDLKGEKTTCLSICVQKQPDTMT